MIAEHLRRSRRRHRDLDDDDEEEESAEPATAEGETADRAEGETARGASNAVARVSLKNFPFLHACFTELLRVNPSTFFTRVRCPTLYYFMVVCKL